MKLDSNEKTNQLPKTFYVTYFARTHNGQPIKNGGAIITRKGQWVKPDSDVTGKAFISAQGNICFIYWDLDAEPNEQGLQWRMAKNPMRVRAI